MKAEGTYDSIRELTSNFEKIEKVFSGFDVKQIYIKELSSNDNSKNQLYLASHITDLSFIPTGSPQASQTLSKKKSKPGNNIKFQFPVNFTWVDSQGERYSAPNAKLIYYPQYPEVRFSGYLKGSSVSMSTWMDRYKQGTSPGRFLILGVSGEGKVYGYLSTPGSAISNELAQTNLMETSSVLKRLAPAYYAGTDSKSILLEKLRNIHQMGWVDSQKLTKNGPEPYKAINGGGLTLESLLGVLPNGNAEPDFLDWEIKQFNVTGFPESGTKPTTLMTPAPDGGFYFEKRVEKFVRCFGYPDKSGIADRYNFGGKHVFGKDCTATGLTLSLSGFDFVNQKLADVNGDISLLSEDGQIAASWSYVKMMDHWKKKHSKAAYIPSMRKTIDGQHKYLYGSTIKLGTETDFDRFLYAIVSEAVFYDPGIKVEDASSSKPKTKERHQFRVNHKNIGSLYENYETVELAEFKYN